MRYGAGVGERKRNNNITTVVSCNVHTWECYSFSSALSVKQDSAINIRI